MGTRRLERWHESIVGDRRGESVWDWLFLLGLPRRFSDVSARRDDQTNMSRYRNEAERLLANLHEHAWDGGWYRRAYFDNGSPLGPNTNDACKIDSIVQSWAALADNRIPHGFGRRWSPSIIIWFAATRASCRCSLHHLIRRNSSPATSRDIYPASARTAASTRMPLVGRPGMGSFAQADKAWKILQMLNPISHAQSAEQADRYGIEPYVVAADVYSQPPHVGRGGWSWYTGSASWFTASFSNRCWASTLSATLFGWNRDCRRHGPVTQVRLKLRDVDWTIEVVRASAAAMTVDGEPWDPKVDVPLGRSDREHSMVMRVIA